MRNAPGAKSRVTSRANISYLSPFFVYAQNTSLVLPLSLSLSRARARRFSLGSCLRVTTQRWLTQDGSISAAVVVRDVALMLRGRN